MTRRAWLVWGALCVFSPIYGMVAPTQLRSIADFALGIAAGMGVSILLNGVRERG